MSEENKPSASSSTSGFTGTDEATMPRNTCCRMNDHIAEANEWLCFGTVVAVTDGNGDIEPLASVSGSIDVRGLVGIVGLGISTSSSTCGMMTSSSIIFGEMGSSISGLFKNGYRYLYT